MFDFFSMMSDPDAMGRIDQGVREFIQMMAAIVRYLDSIDTHLAHIEAMLEGGNVIELTTIPDGGGE